MPLYDISLWKFLKDMQSAEITVMDKLCRFQILECIMRALKDLQTRKFCHLDVKPSNILINLEGSKWNGDLVLSDFGLSGTVESAVGHAGTPGFGSPEQFLGRVHTRRRRFLNGTKLLVLRHTHFILKLISYFFPKISDKSIFFNLNYEL